MKNNNTSKKIIFLLAAIIMGLFASFYFLYEDIKDINENVSALKQDLVDQIKKRQYILSLQRTFQNTDSDITKIDNSIIPKEDEVKFIGDLEAMARKNNLSIEIGSLGFEDSKLFSSSTITALRVSAKTKGPWEGTYKFLAQIESMPFKVKVHNFGLSNGVNDSIASSKTVVWQTSFDISILKYK